LITIAASLAIVLIPVSAVHAQNSESASVPTIPAAIDLQDGDTLVFLGDSITHQRLYTQYVEDFFYTRFPHRRIRFHNAGIGGARAWDALQRVSRDVLDYKPRYVTVLLGMNDGSYQPFNTDIFNTYQSDMLELISKLREGGAIPVLMSPTMFDARTGRLKNRWDEAMLSQYNAVLAYYGKWLQHQAIEQGFSFVDMFGLLNKLTMEQRKVDGNFTLIRDAIHPDAPGQLVMAYAMIEDLGLRKGLSSIRVMNLPNGKLRVAGTGGKASNAVATDAGVEFDWLADGLPWVVPAEAQLGADLTKLGHRASREALIVPLLPAGNYELSIDGTVVGQYSQAQLAGGIELQGNSKTPQYQQAMNVAMLNKTRNEGPVRELRDAWRSFQTWARQSRELSKQPGNEQMAKQVAASREKVDGLEAAIVAAEAASAEIEAKIYEANQPVSRHYKLTRVTPAKK
ncbi:MAG: SGNH/GDSL hydrolase family protein, partial [Planctomycetaceae bacterium]|nr:SGNH/GDSL hydrolase family protein [Planctomycetaceae bacterium]